LSASVLSWLFTMRGKAKDKHECPSSAVPCRSASQQRAVPQHLRTAAPHATARVHNTDHPQPALRASPFPEVTDLICRLPLPTLFQQTRGFEPWRPAAVMGTSRGANKARTLRFMGRHQRTGHPKNGVLFLHSDPISGQSDSRVQTQLKRKENSFRDSR
jgi:hypothetical protein